MQHHLANSRSSISIIVPRATLTALGTPPRREGQITLFVLRTAATISEGGDMKGNRHVKRWGLAVLAGIVLSCSAVVRADTLQVSESVPYFGSTIALSFDWNTATDQIYNLKVTGGFALEQIPVSGPCPPECGAIEFDPQNNAIEDMDFSKPNGQANFLGDFFQIVASEFPTPNNFEVPPKPGIYYNVQMYENCVSCVPKPLLPNWFQGTVTVVKLPNDPVSEPVPSMLLLGGFGVLLLARSLRRL